MDSHVPNAAYYLAGQSGVFSVAVGSAGMAKSSSLESLAKKLDIGFYQFIPSWREPTDAGGIPHLVEYKLDDSRTVKCVEMVSPKFVFDALMRPSLLFVDEMNCCTPAMQAAMLGMVFERKVGDVELPESTLTFGACNPPSLAANGVPFEAPLANRMMHHIWEFPREAWMSGMRNGQDFPEPTPPLLADDWKTNMFTTSSLIAEFHDRVPGYLHPETDDEGNPQLSNAERSGAWPSPRTWSLAARALAGAKSADASTEVQYSIVKGCVGFSAAEAFDEYVDNLDMPDPEPVIQDVERAMARKDSDEVMRALVPRLERADKVRVFLGSVTGAIARETTPSRWYAAQEILRQSMIVDKEVSLVCAGPLYANKPKNVKISPEMVETIWNTVGRTLDEKGGEA